mmetsp:Transcript_26660/g.86126  ORF Transcript_26660/g.86126 Transcript_26660/m.86126 type:complete len:226 (+) Transcript_26660:248-925(+)|eukprot:scaffold11177_cov86-Isochrysis_galbana.AAC.4
MVFARGRHFLVLPYTLLILSRVPVLGAMPALRLALGGALLWPVRCPRPRALLRALLFPRLQPFPQVPRRGLSLPRVPRATSIFSRAIPNAPPTYVAAAPAVPLSLPRPFRPFTSARVGQAARGAGGVPRPAGGAAGGARGGASRRRRCISAIAPVGASRRPRAAAAAPAVAFAPVPRPRAAGSLRSTVPIVRPSARNAPPLRLLFARIAGGRRAAFRPAAATVSA